MNEKQLKTIIENKEELDKKIEEYLTKKILLKQEISDGEIKGHIEKSEHNLKFSKDTLKQGYSDWALIGFYYSAYHISLALLLKRGYYSKNHDATLCVLIKHYYGKEISKEDLDLLNLIYLDYQDILFYVQSKQEREKASYSSQRIFKKELINEVEMKTILFVNKCKEILKNE